ncbi:MAG: hypothetical protein ABSB74_04465 [Tepidisphaeraceae bacterium]
MKSSTILLSFALAILGLLTLGRVVPAQSAVPRSAVGHWEYATLGMNEITTIGSANAAWKEPGADSIPEEVDGAEGSYQGNNTMLKLAKHLTGKDAPAGFPGCEIATILNWAGSKGWQLVSVNAQKNELGTNWVYIFERPAP